MKRDIAESLPFTLHQLRYVGQKISPHHVCCRIQQFTLRNKPEARRPEFRQEVISFVQTKGGAPQRRNMLQDVHVFSLFEELEQNGFLGPDKLTTLKDLLRALKEWSLFGHVKTFEIKRKEYNSLLERIILDLDQRDCLEQLVAICRDRIRKRDMAAYKMLDHFSRN